MRPSTAPPASGRKTPSDPSARKNSKPSSIQRSHAASAWFADGHRIQRQPAAKQQRVADAMALVAAVGQADLRAQRRAGLQQVEPVAGGGVDGDDRLAAEAEHGARDRLDVTGLVERRDELLALRAATFVQRAELLVAGRPGDVDAAIAHGFALPRQAASCPSRLTASSRRSSGVVSEMRKKPSPLGPYAPPGETTTPASSSTCSQYAAELSKPAGIGAHT